MPMWNIFIRRTVDPWLGLNVKWLRIAELAAARFLAPSIIPFSVPSILPWQDFELMRPRALVPN